MIDPTDRGFTLADGLFETVLSEGGAFAHLDLHLARLAQGCAVLGLPAPGAGEVERRMEEALRAAGLAHARAAVRVSWSAGSGGRGLDRPETLSPTLAVTAAPAPIPSAPARLATAQVRRNDGSPASRLKTLAYLDNVLARREARARGCDEAVMLNTRGEVACAAAANLFWIRGERLFTPALGCGVLPGIVRGRLIAAAAELGIAVEEAAFGPADLAAAEAIFLTNSLIGLRPVAELDGKIVGDSRLVDLLLGALGIS
ncbi:aminotransferase class IV [Phenylobacterium soli]|uniref:Probable branched-chain-amino-acid aminotransferase n=1 Tax=Phenylobacterium soli TaxID=2170551 RepID=A0A328AH22_9CAUL|nr:aminotransferase class IV [Phenylobacterium soli]RAK53949.1 4-amino-4-deoxychorismate lyase [Phenylobacterium soli]